jgi:DNA-binding LacI/PurR family transcriptional regulator
LTPRSKANAKIELVAEQAADWLRDKAQTAFAAMLQAHPNIKAVYASNDMMAAGVRLAANFSCLPGFARIASRASDRRSDGILTILHVRII